MTVNIVEAETIGQEEAKWKKKKSTSSGVVLIHKEFTEKARLVRTVGSDISSSITAGSVHVARKAIGRQNIVTIRIKPSKIAPWVSKGGFSSADRQRGKMT